jgi:hypothetical protein
MSGPILPCPAHVRFTLNSDLIADVRDRPFRAISRHFDVC